MISILIYFLVIFFSSSLSADETQWLRKVSSRVDDEAVEWFKSELKKRVEEIDGKEIFAKFNKQIEVTKVGKKCIHGMSLDDVPENPKLMVFMSLSIPRSSWVDLSKELEKTGGVFVLRGLPNNSFPAYASTLIEMRKNKIDAPIQMNPKLFEKYEVDKVPAFVISDENGYDKLSGNVSLAYALECFAEKGETKVAQELIEMLSGELR